MKYLSYSERKQCSLGILLMSALIALYCVEYWDGLPGRIFCVVFSVIWVAYVVMFIVSMVAYRKVTIPFYDNVWILRAANCLSVFGLILWCVLVASFLSEVVAVRAGFTLFIITLLCMYIYAVFGEKDRGRSKGGNTIYINFGKSAAERFGDTDSLGDTGNLEKNENCNMADLYAMLRYMDRHNDAYDKVSE